MFYITSMWVAGIMQGLMWRAYDQFGFLQYSFAESVVAVHPYYVIRLLGGLLFLSGALIMVYNLILTVRSPTTEASRHAAPIAPARRWRENKTMFIRHEFIEKNAFLLLVLTLVTIAIGGMVEVVPLFTIETTVEHVKGVRPYSPLELRGRDIYVREAATSATASRSARCAMKWSATAITRSPPRACTTIRSSGARSASVPTWRGSAANTPTTGTTRI